MSKEDLELDSDDFLDDDEPVEDIETSAASSKNNLSKRREIDNLLEERRLSKALAEYDYDLD